MGTSSLKPSMKTASALSGKKETLESGSEAALAQSLLNWLTQLDPAPPTPRIVRRRYSISRSMARSTRACNNLSQRLPDWRSKSKYFSRLWYALDT